MGAVALRESSAIIISGGIGRSHLPGKGDIAKVDTILTGKSRHGSVKTRCIVELERSRIGEKRHGTGIGRAELQGIARTDADRISALRNYRPMRSHPFPWGVCAELPESTMFAPTQLPTSCRCTF